MYLLGARVGFPGQDALWEFVSRGQLQLIDLDQQAWERSRALMVKYRDTPMSLADATLVAVAEERGINRVFALDRDFTVYRLDGRRRFEVIPYRQSEAKRPTSVQRVAAQPRRRP